MRKIILAGLIVLSCAVLLPANAWAERTFKVNVGGKEVPIDNGRDVCDGLDDLEKEAAGCDDVADLNKPWEITQNVINMVIAVLGIVAVIFIIIGGTQFVTSQGDSTKTKKARDTILYAVLGVVLAAAAYAIVNFVLANVFGDQGAGGGTAESSAEEQNAEESTGEDAGGNTGENN